MIDEDMAAGATNQNINFTLLSSTDGSRKASVAYTAVTAVAKAKTTGPGSGSATTFTLTNSGVAEGTYVSSGWKECAAPAGYYQLGIPNTLLATRGLLDVSIVATGCLPKTYRIAVGGVGSTALVADGYARTIYVATTGSNSNSGLSRTAPVLTHAYAASIAVAGDRITVLPGTYAEAPTVPADVATVNMPGVTYAVTVSGAAVAASLGARASFTGGTVAITNSGSAGGLIVGIDSTGTNARADDVNVTFNNAAGDGSETFVGIQASSTNTVLASGVRMTTTSVFAGNVVATSGNVRVGGVIDLNGTVTQPTGNAVQIGGNTATTGTGTFSLPNGAIPTAAQVGTQVWTTSATRTITGGTVTTNSDKAGYSLSGTQTFSNTGTWIGNITGNLSGSAGSVSGITFPTNFSALGINASGHLSRVTLADTLTAYTGNTPQTGDGYAAIVALAAKFVGITLVAKWLRAFLRSDAPDATALAEINASGGTYDATTDSGQAIRDRGDAAWVTGASASGAYAIEVHVIDEDSVPIVGALVRYSQSGVTRWIGNSDAGGIAEASVDAGYYTRTTTYDGFNGVVETNVHVTADAAETVQMDRVTFSDATNPSQTTAYITTLDGQGAAAAGVTLSIRMASKGTAGLAWDRQPFTSPASDANGLLQVALAQATTYQAKRGNGAWVTFTTGTGGTYQLPEVLGEAWE